MKISVLGEHGYLMALFGLGFSYGHTSGLTFDGVCPANSLQRSHFPFQQRQFKDVII